MHAQHLKLLKNKNLRKTEINLNKNDSNKENKNKINYFVIPDYFGFVGLSLCLLPVKSHLVWMNHFLQLLKNPLYHLVAVSLETIDQKAENKNKFEKKYLSEHR